MRKFLVEWELPPSPCIKFANRFLYTMKKLRAHHSILCQSDHLTSARFEHFVCHIYIYGIYFHLSVQCL